MWQVSQAAICLSATYLEYHTQYVLCRMPLAKTPPCQMLSTVSQTVLLYIPILEIPIYRPLSQVTSEIKDLWLWLISFKT